MASENQRKSLQELGLGLPFPAWLLMFGLYLGSAAVLYFVPDSDAPLLRMAALSASMFIMGVFCAFKLPLWVRQQA